jgi:hypothetical protein
VVPCREGRCTRDATIVIERKEAIFTIDKRRTGSLSFEKIFVAVCERSLTHAMEARTAPHTAPQWARNRSRVDARSIL